jgi:hypothetical protein
MRVPAAMPGCSVLVFRSLRWLDAFAALAALVLGFCLVGLVLVVAFPLIAMISGGRTTLKRLLDIGSRRFAEREQTSKMSETQSRTSGQDPQA